jgi:hypothetical protein
MAAQDLGAPAERDRLDSLVATIQALRANGVADPLGAMRTQLEEKLRSGIDTDHVRGALALIDALETLATGPRLADS